jgi:apolipoprotein N-acyltransferase
MIKITFGIFLILHGLVHLLYFGQGMRLFELSGLTWPDSGWAFSRLLGQVGTRTVAGIACVVAVAVFITAGIAFFADTSWWRPLTMVATIFSTLIWVLFWDGRMQNLSGQGLYAILINIGIYLATQVFHWPK